MKTIFAGVVSVAVLVGVSVGPALAQEVVGTYQFNSSGQVTGQSASLRGASGAVSSGSGARMEVPFQRSYGLAGNTSASGNLVTKDCSEVIKSNGKRYLICR